MFTENQYKLATHENAHFFEDACDAIISGLLKSFELSDHSNFAADVDIIHNLKWTKDFRAYCRDLQKYRTTNNNKPCEPEPTEVKF